MNEFLSLSHHQDILAGDIIRKYNLVIAGIEFDPVTICPARIDRQDDRLRIAPPAYTDSGIDIGRKVYILPFHGLKSFLHDI